MLGARPVDWEENMTDTSAPQAPNQAGNGEAMPGLRVLDTQIAADVVAYLQTLPQ